MRRHAPAAFSWSAGLPQPKILQAPLSGNTPRGSDAPGPRRSRFPPAPPPLPTLKHFALDSAHCPESTAVVTEVRKTYQTAYSLLKFCSQLRLTLMSAGLASLAIQF